MSLRRGARSSCQHVHVSLMARDARGRDPRLSDTRQLCDSVHNAEELSQQPDSLSQASHLFRPLSTVPLRTLSPCVSQAPTKTLSEKLSDQPPHPHTESSFLAVSQPRLAILLFLLPCSNRASFSFSHFSSTPLRSGNEGVSLGTEANRREERAGKPARTVVLAAPPSVPWRSGPHGARSMV